MFEGNGNERDISCGEDETKYCPKLKQFLYIYKILFQCYLFAGTYVFP